MVGPVKIQRPCFHPEYSRVLACTKSEFTLQEADGGDLDVGGCGCGTAWTGTLSLAESARHTLSPKQEGALWALVRRLSTSPSRLPPVVAV